MARTRFLFLWGTLGALMSVLVASCAVLSGDGTGPPSGFAALKRIVSDGYFFEAETNKIWTWWIVYEIGGTYSDCTREDADWSSRTRAQRLKSIADEKLELRPPPAWAWSPETPPNHRDPPARVTVISIGFPLRCFQGRMEYRPNPQPGVTTVYPPYRVVEGSDPSKNALGLELGNFMYAHGVGGWAVPTRVLWFGLLVDTIFWGLAFFLAHLGVRRFRARIIQRRLDRGQCPRCRYPIYATRGACPECGLVSKLST